MRVLSGVSFVEPACLALGIDPLERDGLQIVDAMVVAASHAPPFDTSRPALLAQCYSRALASDVKLTLLHSFDDQHPVTVLSAAGTAQQALRAVPLFELDRSADFDHLTTLYVPPAGPYGAYSRLQEIVAHLRAPDGCPWDREQTLQTLRKDVLEELFELLEALDRDDDEQISEELGDARAGAGHAGPDCRRGGALPLAAGDGAGLREADPSPSARLRRRGGERGGGGAGQLGGDQGGGGKGRQTGKAGNGVLDSVPRALPALALANKYQSRLGRAGITPDLSGADPIGLALWKLVAEARTADVDAETALREVCRRVAEALE